MWFWWSLMAPWQGLPCQCPLARWTKNCSVTELQGVAFSGARSTAALAAHTSGHGKAPVSTDLWTPNRASSTSAELYLFDLVEGTPHFLCDRAIAAARNGLSCLLPNHLPNVWKRFIQKEEINTIFLHCLSPCFWL